MRWLLVLLAGCVNYDDVVHVHVRDPARVVVGPSSDPSVDIVTVAGVVSAQCPWCAYDRERFVVTPSARIDLVGDTDNLQRAGGDLHMRYAYVAPLPCIRHRGLCERPAFSIDVTTPRDNISAIDFERHVSRDHGELLGAKLGLATGIFADLVGATLLAFDIGWVQSGRAQVAGVAGGFLAIGTFFIATGVRTLAANDSDTALPP